MTTYAKDPKINEILERLNAKLQEDVLYLPPFDMRAALAGKPYVARWAPTVSYSDFRALEHPTHPGWAIYAGEWIAYSDETELRVDFRMWEAQ